jgi:hypothetical protein
MGNRLPHPAAERPVALSAARAGDQLRAEHDYKIRLKAELEIPAYGQKARPPA